MWANRPPLIAAVDLQVKLIDCDWPQAGVSFARTARILAAVDGSCRFRYSAGRRDLGHSAGRGGKVANHYARHGTSLLIAKIMTVTDSNLYVWTSGYGKSCQWG